MDKEKYFEESNKLKISKRCPYIKLCGRHALTEVVFTRLGGGNLWRLEDEKKELVGEGPWIQGKSYDRFSFGNICPEISLFDNEHRPVGMEYVACTTGNFDFERKNAKRFQSQETKHYTECPEYAYFKTHKTKSKQNRKHIPNKIKRILQQEIKSACPFCESPRVSTFEIHHINGDTTNIDISNLLMLCSSCHTDITNETFSYFEVISKKRNLSLNNQRIELANLRLAENKSSWKILETGNSNFAIQIHKKDKNPNPILDIVIINNSQDTVILNKIAGDIHFLFSGFSGFPETYALKSTNRFRLVINNKNKRGELILKDPIVIKPKTPYRFELEIAYCSNRAKSSTLLNSRSIVNLNLLFSNDITLQLQPVFLNTINESNSIQIRVLQ